GLLPRRDRRQFRKAASGGRKKTSAEMCRSAHLVRVRNGRPRVCCLCDRSWKKVVGCQFSVSERVGRSPFAVGAQGLRMTKCRAILPRRDSGVASVLIFVFGHSCEVPHVERDLSFHSK